MTRQNAVQAVQKVEAEARAPSQVKKTVVNKDIKSLNKWGHAPPCTCQSCKQNTHTIEIAAPDDDPYYVVWTQSCYSARIKMRKPSGRECYVCAHTRRRHYIREDRKVASLEEVEEFKSQNPEALAQWWDFRRGIATGATAYQAVQQVVVDASTSQKDKAYKKGFVTGTFHELWAFARHHELPFIPDRPGDKELLIKRVEQNMPTWRHAYDEEFREEGFEQIDQPPGQRRFQRGLGASVEKTKKQKHVDNEEALDEYEHLQARLLPEGVRCGNEYDPNVRSPDKPGQEGIAFDDGTSHVSGDALPQRIQRAVQ